MAKSKCKTESFGCSPIIALQEDLRAVHARLPRIDALEKAVTDVATSIATLVESNRWLQRAVLGIYGLIGAVCLAGISWAWFR